MQSLTNLVEPPISYPTRESMMQKMVFNLIKLGLGPVVRGGWLGEVGGIENFPRSGPVIVAANHASHMDSLLLFAALPRQLSFMPAGVLYRNPLLNMAFRYMGFIKVYRNEPHKVGALRSAMGRLEQGRAVAIFPEGMRTEHGGLIKARNGVGYLALASQAPIVPVHIAGSFQAWPRYRNLPVPHQCHVRIGVPIHVAHHGLPRRRKEAACELTRTVMQAIADLGNTHYPY